MPLPSLPVNASVKFWLKRATPLLFVYALAGANPVPIYPARYLPLAHPPNKVIPTQHWNKPTAGFATCGSPTVTFYIFLNVRCWPMHHPGPTNVSLSTACPTTPTWSGTFLTPANISVINPKITSTHKKNFESLRSLFSHHQSCALLRHSLSADALKSTISSPST